MSELDKQPFSVRFNQVIGGSAGHTMDTALSEIGLDNASDAEATELLIIDSPSKSSFCLLDNGTGIQNINNILGCGKGIKIKSSDKIGCKIAGELAAIGYFKSDKLCYFSRTTSSELGRKHQQMNLKPRKIISIIQTEDIDLSEADEIILRGTNSQEKLISIPIPSRDKFDTDDVNEIKNLFNNNTELCNYLTNESKTGMLKVIKYNKIKSGEQIVNRKKYLDFNNKIVKILDNYESLVYNTKKFLRGNFVIKYINVDDESKNRLIDKNSSRNLLILGKNSIESSEEEEEEEEDVDEEEDEEELHFDKLNNNRVLSIDCNFYNTNNNSNKINICKIKNFDETFVIDESKPDIEHISKGKNPSAKPPIFEIGTSKIFISVLDKDEATEQGKRHGSTLESLKQIYVYYNGRLLSKCLIPGLKLQPKNLSNIRIVFWLNPSTNSLVNVQSNKSKFSLDESEKIIQKTISDLIIPIMGLFDCTKGCVIQNCVENWDDHENKIMRSLNCSPPPLPLPLPDSSSINELFANSSAAASSSSSSNGLIPNKEPIVRDGGLVERPLTKNQALEEITRLKNELNVKRVPKKEKDKIITKIFAISRNIIQDYDLMDDLFDFTTKIITSSKSESVIIKDAVSLKKFKY